MNSLLKSASLAVLTATALSTLSVAAPEVKTLPKEGLAFGGGARPPQGNARPPFHIHPNIVNSVPTGLTPSQIRKAYGFDKIANQGAGQTIAIIDAYDDPNIEADLGIFSSKFGLSPCNSANGCFQKAYASGVKPKTNSGWALEIALDVEWAHAIAPDAKIMLIEANSAQFTDLLKAVDYAVGHGASVVSMSFGGSEFGSETSSSYDGHFNKPHVTFLASSGDSGNGAEYPAASQYVVSVGGTTLNVDSTGAYLSETAWSGSGGGLSAYEPELAGQAASSIPYETKPAKRGIPDVSYNGDPNTGFPVYDSVAYYGVTGWFQVGGTSAGAPQWAGLIAIANSLRNASSKLPLSGTNTLLYDPSLSSGLFDIKSGSNGTCGNLCTALGGYDYVTGLGSPYAPNLIPGLASF